MWLVIIEFRCITSKSLMTQFCSCHISIINALMLMNVSNYISGFYLNMNKSGLAGINMADSTVSSLPEAIGCRKLASP